MIPASESPLNRWTLLADTLVVPHTEAEYERLVAMVDELIDTVGENEDHSLAGLMETVGVDVNRIIPEVVTVYRTSKVQKYWES